MLYANHTGCEAYSHRISQGDMRRKRQRDFDLRSCRDRAVQVEEHSPRADILGFSLEFVGALQADNSRQAHVEAPHHPPFLCIRLHARALRHERARQGKPLPSHTAFIFEALSSADAASCTSMYRIISSLQQQKLCLGRIRDSVRILEQDPPSPWEDALLRMALLSLVQSLCHKMPAPTESLSSIISAFTNSRVLDAPLRAGPCRIFPKLSRITFGCAIRFSHFCATPRHLSSSPGASDESWSQAGGRGRLTCLSSRCLSSCLFFPPVPVTSKRAGSPDLVRRRNARTDSCAVSKPLH